VTAGRRQGATLEAGQVAYIVFDDAGSEFRAVEGLVDAMLFNQGGRSAVQASRLLGGN